MPTSDPLTVAPAVGFRSGPAELVVGHDQRMAQGLAHWVDGAMGFHRHGGRTTVISPNGARIARHELGRDGWRAPPRAADIALTGSRTDADHASGGPVHYDADTGQLLLFYHGEHFHDGDASDYYSFIGLAVSDDDGGTFHDLGRILTSDLDEDDPTRTRPMEMGPGSFVVRDGWFLVYFQDRGNGPTRKRLSVARARVADVVDDARHRRTPTFHKYHLRRWTEPGLGGRSSELLDVPWVVWFDTALIEPLDCALLVYSSSWLVGSDSYWMYYATLSRDGLEWSVPQPLLDAPVNDEIIYLTIDSGGPDQRTITGPTFEVYRTHATTRYRWDHAWLERIPVTWERLTDRAG